MSSGSPLLRNVVRGGEPGGERRGKERKGEERRNYFGLCTGMTDVPLRQEINGVMVGSGEKKRRGERKKRDYFKIVFKSDE